MGFTDGQNLNFAIASTVLNEFIHSFNHGAIFELAKNGTVHQLREALKAGANFNITLSTGGGDYGETPLHIAASYNHNPESIRFLISQGLDVKRYQGHFLDTPLSCALHYKNMEAIKELLKAGADGNIYTNGQEGEAIGYFPGSALHIVAYEYKNYSVAKNIIQALIKAGCDVNNHSKVIREETKIFDEYDIFPKYKTWTEGDPWGNFLSNLKNIDMGYFLSSCTPLMYAVLCDNANVVNILLDAGADPNIHDFARRTALDYAQDLPRTTKIKTSSTFARLKAATK